MIYRKQHSLLIMYVEQEYIIRVSLGSTMDGISKEFYDIFFTDNYDKIRDIYYDLLSHGNFLYIGQSEKNPLGQPFSDMENIRIVQETLSTFTMYFPEHTFIFYIACNDYTTLYTYKIKDQTITEHNKFKPQDEELPLLRQLNIIPFNTYYTVLYTQTALSISHEITNIFSL